MFYPKDQIWSLKEQFQTEKLAAVWYSLKNACCQLSFELVISKDCRHVRRSLSSMSEFLSFSLFWKSENEGLNMDKSLRLCMKLCRTRWRQYAREGPPGGGSDTTRRLGWWAAETMSTGWVDEGEEGFGKKLCTMQFHRKAYFAFCLYILKVDLLFWLGLI